jgi:type IV pilus assembly protein PilW
MTRWVRERGATLVDVLVGLVIALLTIAVVYQAFVLVQTVGRSTAAAADAQGSAAFALFAVAAQAANAGAGLAPAADHLDACPAAADVALSLRPIDVLITDGGAADRPDTLVVRQSFARGVAAPVAFAGPVAAGADFRVESSDGFDVGDRIAVISPAGACLVTSVTGVASGGAGVLDIAHSPVTVDFPATSVVLNLGPAQRAATARYDLVAGTLRSTDVSNADAPNPLVSNIVNVKFQYGIDSDGDGALDTWVAATAGSSWSATAILAAPRSLLARIKALRIGVIARTERPERTRTRGDHWVLFDCELDDKALCPGRLEGTIAATAAGGYRYRALETVVPLRNAIWNHAP